MSRTDAIVVAKVTAPAEREACLSIRRQVFVEEQKVPPEIEYDECDKTALHFLASRNRIPVATARIVFKDNGATAKIGRVAVLKESRGLGIGRAVMLAAEADKEAMHAVRFVLEAQTYAIPFYERLGYKAEGGVHIDAGIPHRFMSKDNPQSAHAPQARAG